MRKTGVIALALVVSAITGSSSVAAPQVSVRFVESERFTDAVNRFGSGLTRRATLGETTRIFGELGRRWLRPGQSLAIDVLDIDLAGIEEPGANFPHGLRVVRDVSPPRFRLRYVLTERGRRALSGEEAVTDITFLMRASRFSSGALSHERDLLRDWFQRRIVERVPARG